jgi:hypothetical protein
MELLALSFKDELIDNVTDLLTKYPIVRQNDKKLIMLYWKFFDGVKMDKTSISSEDFLYKATPPEKIIQTKWMVQIQNPELEK